MKTTLSTLLITFLTALAGQAAEPAKPSPATGEGKGALKPCGECTKAPCHCGFSPSYYTHHRKPLKRVLTEFAPIAPHWSRPRRCSPTVNPFAVYSTAGTARPSSHGHWSASDHRPGHNCETDGQDCMPACDDHCSASDHCPGHDCEPDGRVCIPGCHGHLAWLPVCERPRVIGGTLVPSPRRAAVVPRPSFHQALGRAVPDTIVPNPRRPRAVPAVTPKVIPAVTVRTSLRYVPKQSWSPGGAPRGGFRTARAR